jgi:hypothetical protein
MPTRGTRRGRILACLPPVVPATSHRSAAADITTAAVSRSTAPRRNSHGANVATATTAVPTRYHTACCHHGNVDPPNWPNATPMLSIIPKPGAFGPIVPTAPDTAPANAAVAMRLA